MSSIRVLIIDDSAFMRKMITDILKSDRRIEVVDTARNGQDGLRKIQILKPDVVTLDIEMPIMDGINTLQKIMETCPLPVVMLSSLTSNGAKETLRALSLGAIDFIQKPSGPISLDINNIKLEIIEKVIAASQARTEQKTFVENVQPIDFKAQSYAKTFVVIGTSTGGPRALQNILTKIPSDFKATILIVQHMPATFTRSLAERLNSVANIQVKEASNGELLQKGTAYIAPGDFHMEVSQVGMSHAIKLSKEPLVRGHRPAVDVLFQSVSRIKNVNKIAVVLTGMGKDGAEGIKEIRKRDSEAIIIAESEQSSIVYGMPAAAISTGYVNKVMHLDHIGESIVKLLN